jgi:16S rRNA (guanine527-N7)-methyltransferase
MTIKIMEKELERILTEGAAELGVGLDTAAQAAFFVYLRELKAWNRKINLTAIEDDRDIVVRHFLDSLTVCRLLKGSERLLDVGAGAGFPGIPIKIAMPGTDVVLMDSVSKKVHFIRHIARTLGLKGLEAVSCRVEEKAAIEKYGGTFDCVVSRAFAELRDFVSAGLPYLKAGGRLIAMKGPAYAGELGAVDLKGLGLNAPEVHRVRLPSTDIVTVHVVFTRENH